MNTNSINVLWSFFHPIVIKFESDRHVLVKTLRIKPNKNYRPVGVGIVPCGRMSSQAGGQQTSRSVWSRSLFLVVSHGHTEVDLTEIEWQHVDWILHVTLSTNK
jgi:hypothetical protein